MVIQAITRFKNRNLPVEIPDIRNPGIHGFSHEYINYMLGGTFRGSYTPLNDNIINGRIRGVAGVVGCTNPRVKHDAVHVALVQELIKNDVLVLQTGCSQVALAKAGFLRPEAAPLAGPGLNEVCEAVGMPPVLGFGSCVDNSRILMAASEMVANGGLGKSIADLPAAGAAPRVSPGHGPARAVGGLDRCAYAAGHHHRRLQFDFPGKDGYAACSGSMDTRDDVFSFLLPCNH